MIIKFFSPKNNLLFFSFTLIALLSSCKQTQFIINTNVPESLYLAEAYNKTHKIAYNFKVLLNNDPYHRIIENNTSLIISTTKPNSSQKKQLIKKSLILPQNVKTNMEVSLPYQNVLAFSIPLIVIKKNQNLSLPPSRYISHEQLQTLIVQYTKTYNALSANKQKQASQQWAFNINPHISFQDTFNNTQEYKTWMNTNFKDFENQQKKFENRYKNIQDLALLQTNFIAYNYIPSHIFFSQSQEIINNFEIAILTNNRGQVPAIDCIFASIVNKKSTKFNSKRLLRWFFKEKNQKYVYEFTKDILKNTIPTHLFLGRSYSTLSNTNTFILQPQNAWLWHYGPLDAKLTVNSQ